MSCLTVLVDIAGRPSLDTSDGPRITAAAVTVRSAEAQRISSALSPSFPKWQTCREQDADRITRLLVSYNATTAVFSVDKNTCAWGRFWKDAELLKATIVEDRRGPAGFAKAANVLTFYLFGVASAMAVGHAIRLDSEIALVDSRGRRVIERTVICDSDIKGAESIDLFKSFWDQNDRHQPLVNSLGVRLVTRDVRVSTEQEEPLLLLADYAAGIAHAAFTDDPGNTPFPLPAERAKQLLRSLDETGRLVLQDTQFDISYDEIFGWPMKFARNRRAPRRKK